MPSAASVLPVAVPSSSSPHIQDLDGWSPPGSAQHASKDDSRLQTRSQTRPSARGAQRQVVAILSLSPNKPRQNNGRASPSSRNIPSTKRANNTRKRNNATAPASASLPTTAETQLTAKREKNRVAAGKCREKKQYWEKNLEARARLLQNNNSELATILDTMRQEQLFLKEQIVRHSWQCSSCSRQLLDGMAPELSPVSRLSTSTSANGSEPYAPWQKDDHGHEKGDGDAYTYYTQMTKSHGGEYDVVDGSRDGEAEDEDQFLSYGEL